MLQKWKYCLTFVMRAWFQSSWTRYLFVCSVVSILRQFSSVAQNFSTASKKPLLPVRHCDRCGRHGSNSKSVKSDTVSPTACHRCDVSSELCCPGTEPRIRTPPHVTRFGVLTGQLLSHLFISPNIQDSDSKRLNNSNFVILEQKNEEYCR